MHPGAKDQINTARTRYFQKHPFDPHEKALLSHDENGIPAGFLTLPDMGEMQVVAMKYGYEFLATVRTDDDVDDWLSNVMTTAQSPDLAGIMLAHAFRGIAPIIGQIIDRDPGLVEVMHKISADGWEKEF